MSGRFHPTLIPSPEERETRLAFHGALPSPKGRGRGGVFSRVSAKGRRHKAQRFSLLGARFHPTLNPSPEGSEIRPALHGGLPSPKGRAIRRDLHVGPEEHRS